MCSTTCRVDSRSHKAGLRYGTLVIGPPIPPELAAEREGEAILVLAVELWVAILGQDASRLFGEMTAADIEREWLSQLSEHPAQA